MRCLRCRPGTRSSFGASRALASLLNQSSSCWLFASLPTNKAIWYRFGEVSWDRVAVGIRRRDNDRCRNGRCGHGRGRRRCGLDDRSGGNDAIRSNGGPHNGRTRRRAIAGLLLELALCFQVHLGRLGQLLNLPSNLRGRPRCRKSPLVVRLWRWSSMQRREHCTEQDSMQHRDNDQADAQPDPNFILHQ